jgi:hypothetical protein
MIETTLRNLSRAAVVLISLSLNALAQEASAAQSATTTSLAADATTTSPATGTSSPIPTASPDADDRANYAEVRGEFRELIRSYPSEVATLLAVEPTLLRNEQWLQGYPEIAAFVRENPHVHQNPAAYADDDLPPPRYVDNRSAEERVMDDFFEAVSISIVIPSIAFAFFMLIRTILTHRRWTRATRIHTEMQHKLLDRLSSHDDLVRYIDNGGLKWIEPALSREVSSQPLEAAAPMSRMLLTIQAGIVLLVAGIGFLFTSLRFSAEASQGFFGFGMLGLFVGTGLLLSAYASYAVSRKLGLVKPAVETSE